MLKKLCLITTLFTVVIALLPLAPKVALGQGCYMMTSDGWRIDLNSLCKSIVPAYAISKVNTSNNHNPGGPSLDLPYYCKQKYGSDAAVTLQENNALGWKCMVEGHTQDIAFDEACNMEYGPFAQPAMGEYSNVGSWHCTVKSSEAYQASGS